MKAQVQDKNFQLKAINNFYEKNTNKIKKNGSSNKVNNNIKFTPELIKRHREKIDQNKEVCKKGKCSFMEIHFSQLPVQARRKNYPSDKSYKFWLCNECLEFHMTILTPDNL